MDVYVGIDFSYREKARKAVIGRCEWISKRASAISVDSPLPLSILYYKTQPVSHC